VRGQTDLIASAAYQPEPAAAAAARRFIRQTLQSWDIAERSREADRLVDDAVLLTSELVTNAVVHAGTALDVTCRIASSELEIAVRDRHPSRTLPDLPEAASMSAERGRGLLLPTALAGLTVAIAPGVTGLVLDNGSLTVERQVDRVGEFAQGPRRGAV